MDVAVADVKSFEWEADSVLMIPLHEGSFPLRSEVLERDDEVVLQALADQEVLRGAAQEAYFLPRASGPCRGVLTAGLGKPEAVTAEVLRRTAGKAAALLRQHRVRHVLLDVSHFPELPAHAFLEGLVLGQYDFDVYKTRRPEEPAPVRIERLTILVGENADRAAVQEAARLSVLLSLSANGARHLANTPANEMTPASLGEFAEGIAKESGCECTIFGPKELAEHKMNCILGVSQGSAQEPRLIILRHQHSEAVRTVAILGKGVTFDSGGVSLKPPQGMHEMKYDMCGAAAALCAMMSIVELKPAINVVCVVPAAENMSGSRALKPGDVLEAYNGVRIEVENTDAEGRLLLADALAYTEKQYAPDAMVDLATLTGACVVALGHYAAGLFTRDQVLAEALQTAGEETGERVWRLPLWEEYERLIDGQHADVNNAGPKGEAGAITAAAFLKRFVKETPWAHIDIAGVAWGGKNISYLSTDHATGYGVRLLAQWVLNAARDSA